VLKRACFMTDRRCVLRGTYVWWTDAKRVSIDTLDWICAHQRRRGWQWYHRPWSHDHGRWYHCRQCAEELRKTNEI